MSLQTEIAKIIETLGPDLEIGEPEEIKNTGLFTVLIHGSNGKEVRLTDTAAGVARVEYLDSDDALLEALQASLTAMAEKRRNDGEAASESG